MAKRSVFQKHPELCKRIVARTQQIRVGRTYFLSSFYDKKGATVKVVSKSTEINKAGWPSTVIVEVVAPITDGPDEFHMKFYAPGTRHSVNATNLYDAQEDANHTKRYAC